MFKANKNFDLLKANYLFKTIGEKVEKFQKENPNADIIKLGIGDVTIPLVEAVQKALHDAIDDMSRPETFQGYPPYGGYDFLKEAVIKNDYNTLGIEFDMSEVFISDGAKSETANFVDMFANENIIALTDPVYPVYRDSNILAGNAGKLKKDGQFLNFRFLACKAENGFAPQLPEGKVDIIYLCSPNNPTGIAMKYEELEAWVNYALNNGAIILYDGAYERFITTEGIPHSIYEVEGSKKCAVEFRSFSKTAGFTGMRCSYTIVPKDLIVNIKGKETTSLNNMWSRRHTTKFNGVSYIIQKAALACYSKEGKKQIESNIKYYLENAIAIKRCFEALGYEVYGGVDSPYVWLKTPKEMDSWQFFDYLLKEFHVVGTPGSGFGIYGEGYFRLTGFGTHERTQEAIVRIKSNK